MRRLISTMLLFSLVTMLPGCMKSMARPGRSPVASMTPGEPAQTRFLVNVDHNGVALMGHDPVAFFTEKRPVMGKLQFRSVYKGAIYQFATAESKATFEKSPAVYEPQFGGFCAYAASINKVSPISVEYFEILDGRLILQHNQKAWNLWHKDVRNNLVKADTNWPGIVERRGI